MSLPRRRGGGSRRAPPSPRRSRLRPAVLYHFWASVTVGLTQRRAPGPDNVTEPAKSVVSLPQSMTSSFLPPPTIYDVVTVTGVALTLAILLFQWYLDNSAPLRVKLGFSPGVSPYTIAINAFAHFSIDGKNRGRVPRKIRVRIERRGDSDSIFSDVPSPEVGPERWTQILPHEEFSFMVGAQATKEGRGVLRVVVEERGRWWRTHKSPWAEIFVKGWTFAVGAPSPYPPPSSRPPGSVGQPEPYDLLDRS